MIVDEPSVRGRYILGVLAPLGQPSLLETEGWVVTFHRNHLPPFPCTSARRL